MLLKFRTLFLQRPDTRPPLAAGLELQLLLWQLCPGTICIILVMEMGTLWMGTPGVTLGVNSGQPHHPHLLRHPINMGQFRARAQSRAWRAHLPLYPLRKRVSLLVSMPSFDLNEGFWVIGAIFYFEDLNLTEEVFEFLDRFRMSLHFNWPLHTFFIMNFLYF